ncbi:MAG: hypothetical protein J7K73_01970 [Nanoarchaeota archaeon]|nr:hypothetical protein [Nanoarchaeota archaeon]
MEISPLELACIFREMRDIASKGRAIYYPPGLVRNTGINISESGTATYRGPEDVIRFINDQVEFKEIMETLKEEGIIGKIKAYFSGGTQYTPELIDLVKKEIGEQKQPTAEFIERKFYEIIKEIYPDDPYLQIKAEEAYKRPTLRNP